MRAENANSTTFIPQEPKTGPQVFTAPNGKGVYVKSNATSDAPFYTYEARPMTGTTLGLPPTRTLAGQTLKNLVIDGANVGSAVFGPHPAEVTARARRASTGAVVGGVLLAFVAPPVGIALVVGGLAGHAWAFATKG